ncbi:hypothetical protein BKA93DRAFT_820514 [Sparassis latifolia]
MPFSHGFLKNILVDCEGIKECLIARCRSKCLILQLKEKNQVQLPITQRDKILNVLPPPISNVSTPVCVIFHNPLYHDVTINYTALNMFLENDILPVQVEHVQCNNAQDALLSCYDSSDIYSDALNKHVDNTSQATDENVNNGTNEKLLFENVIVTDIDGRAPANELRAAAIRYVTQKNGGYIQVPHDPLPVNEFLNPDLFSLIYPNLFPYGIGGFEDSSRSTALSLKYHVKHLFNLHDRRF